ncbi:uncharacterized protein LOC123540899 isoform X2 [Mercenaria mercenaria]|uniref:uncharacterized protein LOC123540899 isoform X2 n=1 Tax=Mercenaria mercenaria TaxID=6596 RepID=UPI00234E3B0D|nr:uncharacterized protein LOC123540899 isoform X2 [Mercenaria mercenaria]
MFKWLVVCFIAIAVAKWNQNVQATDELNEEEKRLLETLEEKLDQNTVSAAQNEGSPSEEVNKYQKKLWGARFRRVVRRVARRVVPVILARYVPTVVG